MRKVVVITGASSGIGKALANTYHAKGYKLILIGRNESGFRDLKGKDTDVIIADLTVQSALTQISDRIRTTYGRVDLLINNAGITYIQPFEENTPEQVDLIISTNLKAHILLTHLLYPLMQKQKSGHIVFMNSSAGKEGYKNHTLYSATKFGLSGFAKSLRLEAKEHNIKVTSIYPGGVKTQLYRNLKTLVDSTVYMDPKHAAEAVVYLTEAQGYCPDELVLSRMSK